MAEVLGWEDLRVSLDAVRAALDDPKTLAPFAKRLRDKTRAWINSQGNGSWAPFAESTQKRYESEGSSDITKFGKIRGEKIRRLEKQLAKLQTKTSKGGFDDKDRKKATALAKRLKSLRKAKVRPRERADRAAAQIEAIQGRMNDLAAQIRELHRQPNKKGAAEQRQKKLSRLLKMRQRREKAEASAREAAHKTTYLGREIGKATAEKRGGRMMPRMAQTVRASVKRVSRRVLELTVYSKSGIVGQAHHEGLGRDPKRVIIPPLDQDDLQFAADLIAGKCMDAWEGK